MEFIYMFKPFLRLITGFLLFFAMISSAVFYCVYFFDGDAFDALPEEREKVSKAALTDEPPKDDLSSYYRNGYGDDHSVICLYMTVRRGNKTENSDNNWSELGLHSTIWYRENNLERDRVECILQEGDETGPLPGMFGYGEINPNCVVNIRGATTSEAPLKSYTLYMKDGHSWRGQNNVNLNKHTYDPMRFTNKLMYDLMREIPGMISMRTQFVRLFVKDETQNTAADFIDYGFYTNIENPNKTYLKNHGLDPNGQLYKANNFAFYLDDALKPESDDDFDAKAFNRILTVKGSHDHAKLLNMLTDLNDLIKPINETFEKYFDYDNYFTWLAFHLLTGNTDTIERNFLIYSPLNSEKWYFISWDCDYAPIISREDLILKTRETNPNETGIKTYWPNLLHRRVLSYAPYRKILDEYIQKIRSYVTPEKIALKTAVYNEAIRGIVLNHIDTSSVMNGWRAVIELGDYSYKDKLYDNTYDLLYDALPDEYERYYQRYLDSLEDIMPYFLAMPVKDEDGYSVYWDPAYSFNEKRIYYQIEIASDVLFQEMIYSESDIVFPYAYIPLVFPKGRYFLKVKTYYEPGHYTLSNEETHVDGITYSGVFAFNIDENGEVY